MPFDSDAGDGVCRAADESESVRSVGVHVDDRQRIIASNSISRPTTFTIDENHLLVAGVDDRLVFQAFLDDPFFLLPDVCEEYDALAVIVISWVLVCFCDLARSGFLLRYYTPEGEIRNTAYDHRPGARYGLQAYVGVIKIRPCHANRN